MPPRRRPLTTIMSSVMTASVPVTQMLPVAVPPRWRPKSGDTAGDRQQAQQVDRQDEEEDAPDVLDEAVGVLAERRLGDLLAQVLADRLEEVAEAGAAPAEPTGVCRRRAAPSAAPGAISRRPASIIITIWSERIVTLRSGVSKPRSAGRSHQRMGHDVLERARACGVFLGHPDVPSSPVNQPEARSALRAPATIRTSTRATAAETGGRNPPP